MEEKNGEVLAISPDKMFGTLRDDADGSIHDFTNPALLDLSVSTKVIFLLIITPKKEIKVVKDIRG